MSARDPIPARRNAAIVVAITVVQLGVLVVVSHVAWSWWLLPLYRGDPKSSRSIV